MLAGSAVPSSALDGGWRDGILTNYRMAGSACNLPAPGNGLHTAIGDAHFAAGAACGAAIEVRAPGRRPITVTVTNRCPECPAGHLDLWVDTFAKIAPPERGLIRGIRWRFVPARVAGPVQISIREGSSRWWTAIQIRNHRYPIRGLEARGRKGDWVQVPRSDWGYFVAERGLGPGPYTLRITDSRGAQIVESGVPLRPGRVIPGRNQLPA